MATYSTNTTLKVNSAIANNRSTTGNLYTASSTGYAVVMIGYSGSTLNTVGSISIGGMIVFSVSATIGTPTVYLGQFYVGPSQTVAITVTSGTFIVSVAGVEFINTP